MKSIIKKFKEIKSRRLALEEQRRIREVNSSFRMTEQEGKIWLLCNGTAFACFDGEPQCRLALDCLERARRHACRYAIGRETDNLGRSIPPSPPRKIRKEATR